MLTHDPPRRGAETNVLGPDAREAVDPGWLLDTWRRMCRVRQFERGLIEAVDDGRVRYPVYLSTGQEAVAAAMAPSLQGFKIFAQHRCHAIYLAAGGDPARLRDELLGLPGGSSGGRAGSNCLQCHDGGVQMFGHHGLIGENVPLGVGAALGSGEPVVCFFGDGAAEEDYVFAAMAFAASKRLPVLFVCEDNNLSILTPVADRRSWSMTRVARALDLPAREFADDPVTVHRHTEELTARLPAYINCHTCRGNWHVGTGTDGPPEWDRLELVRRDLVLLGLGAEAHAAEQRIADHMRALWNERR